MILQACLRFPCILPVVCQTVRALIVILGRFCVSQFIVRLYSTPLWFWFWFCLVPVCFNDILMVSWFLTIANACRVQYGAINNYVSPNTGRQICKSFGYGADRSQTQTKEWIKSKAFIRPRFVNRVQNGRGTESRVQRMVIKLAWVTTGNQMNGGTGREIQSRSGYPSRSQNQKSINTKGQAESKSNEKR